MTGEERLTPSDFGHLLAGHLYVTMEPYVDFDGLRHEKGETWTFLGHHVFPHDAGLTLHTRGLKGEPIVIRLQDVEEAQGPLIRTLDQHLARLALVPAERTLFCACEQASWTVAAEIPSTARSSGLTVLLCTTCGIMLALEPTEEGAHMIPLDARRRAELERAVVLDPAGAIDDLVSTALACTNAPANLVVAYKLASRTNLLPELAERLASPDQEKRLPVLDMVARMRPVPPVLVPGVVYALRNPITHDGEERLRVLMALYPVAADAPEAKADVEALLRELGAPADELSGMVKKVAETVLQKIDAALEAARAKRAREARQVAELFLDDRDGDAERRALELEPDERHAGGLPARASLFEAAGDELSKHHPDAARRAYARAEALFSQHASGATSGGEGLARMVDVDRLRSKLRR